MADDGKLREQDCRNMKGLDLDSSLLCEVTESIIDADRIVRQTFRNGFPNWAMYRAAKAGDDLYVPMLRQWAAVWAISACETGAVKIRKDAYSEELAVWAGWDAMHCLIYDQRLVPVTFIAPDLGVRPETYNRLRNALYARLHNSLQLYWLHLCSAIRQVVILNRDISEVPIPRVTVVREKGGKDFAPISGNGCFRAAPLAGSDNPGWNSTPEVLPPGFSKGGRYAE